MSTSISQATDGQGGASCEVQRGADAYARTLQAAGGVQLEALMRSDGGNRVCAAIYKAPPYDLRVPALPVFRLSVALTASHLTGGVAGERPHSFDSGRYAVFMAPSGAEMHWRKHAPSRHLAIYFHPDVFDGAEDTPSLLAEPQPLFNLNVPGVRLLADQLVEELDSAGAHHTDAADSLARLLLVQVSRHLRRAQSTSRTLSAATLARLRDYVMAHLSERILVNDMAAQAGLSIDRFAMSYKAQTGQAPHQFVLALRLEHAGRLLRESRLSLAEVANACGFASQQHLTNAMHRHLGTTPRRYRESQQLRTGT
jgi:AraC family transcriptional regulator